MSDLVGRLGVSIAFETFTRLGIVFREQPICDIGIDAHIEIKNPKTDNFDLVALQIKCGQSYLTPKDSIHYTFYFDQRHFDYWSSYSIPVVLLLVDNESRTIVWEHLSVDKIRNTGSGYAIDVPKRKILNKNSISELLKISNKPRYIKNLDYLRMNIPLIRAAKEKVVILEAEEWVNKCSGRGDIALKIYDNDENLIQTLEYNYWFPFQLYEDVFRKLFPWAEFEIDDDFYYDEDVSNYRNECCAYDEEDDKYYDTYTTFREYRESLPDIRYVLVAGEVGRYKLRLSVNKLGESVLLINRYLEEGRPYEGIDITL